MPRARKRLAAKSLIKIGEVCRRSGLSRAMVSSYCMYGLIEEAERTPGGHRLFDADVVKRLKLIRELLAHGYTLRDIREIFLRNK